jgi:hypothetical protein
MSQSTQCKITNLVYLICFCIIFILYRGGVHVTRTECAVDCSTEVDRIVDALDDRKVLLFFLYFIFSIEDAKNK